MTRMTGSTLHQARTAMAEAMQQPTTLGSIVHQCEKFIEPKVANELEGTHVSALADPCEFGRRAEKIADRYLDLFVRRHWDEVVSYFEITEEAA